MKQKSRDQSENNKRLFTLKEIESLLIDNTEKINETIEIEKDNLVKKLQNTIIRYIKNRGQNLTQSGSDHSQHYESPNFDHMVSNNSQVPTFEEEDINDHQDIDGSCGIIPFSNPQSENSAQNISDKIPSGIFNDFNQVGEEEEKSRFEFEEFGQNIPPEELSNIENMKQSGSKVSDPIVEGEQELNTFKFTYNFNNSPIEADENEPADASNNSQISDDHGFNDDFPSDALLDYG